ncbi:Fungal fucose-specific lectin family protein [Penicillium ucsense]|uniref:Fungal fucose-specific lectin family protein n=1 Tax=Penicillium ucsense TaxID=2839758 RepID=A0A8J8WK62_9EURO|nr:Fungal fucose-specific lectin family protein [Penicillium ucsense]KAF7735634.1 Fungal fucose-specific lectin family protein [Penicillium ucsense]
MERRYLELDPSSAPQYVVDRNSDLNVPFVYVPGSDKHPAQHENRRPARKRRKWLLIGGLLLLAIAIAAGTAGGILGTKHMHSSASSPTGTTTMTAPTTASKAPGPSSTPTSNTTGPVNSNLNKDWTYNGTDIMALTYNTMGGDTDGQNYVVFYQNSNLDIRQVVYNNSHWLPSQFITNEARPGSPLSAYWGGNDIRLNLFYVDKNNVLQETRGRQGSSTWVNGTLGLLGVVVPDPGDISVIFVGSCAINTSGWLLYTAGSGDQIGLLYWDASTDTWSHKDTISDVRPHAGFAAHADIGVWRYWYIQQSTSQLKEFVCPDCCSNKSSAGWRPDLIGPEIASNGGMAVAGVGPPRLLYYSDENGYVRELNNTFRYPEEAYIADVSSQPDGGNSGTPVFGNMTVSAPTGQVVATGVPGTRLDMAAGFRGKVQQLWLFYQTSAHDISVRIRNADAAGYWTIPSAVSVGLD